MKTFNKIFLGFCLVAFLGMVSNLVSSYSTYGAPTEFGNINDTTCYIGGDDGDITCLGIISMDMAWVNLSSHPAECPSGTAITLLNDSVTCSALPNTNCSTSGGCAAVYQGANQVLDHSGFSGANITSGNISLGENNSLRLGDSQEAEVYYDGSKLVLKVN